MKWRPAWDLLKNAGRKFSRDRGSRLSAALAFHIALSIAPLLLLILAIVGLSFGKDAARGEVERELHRIVGGESARLVQSMLAHDPLTGGIIAAILGFIILVVGALGAFASLQDALNAVWADRTGKPSHSFWQTLKSEFIAVSMIGVMAILLILSLLFGVIVSQLRAAVEAWLPFSHMSFHLINFAITFVLTGLMFAAFFRFLPNSRPPWAAVWRSALFTAFFLSIGKVVIGLYLGYASLASVYGAAGSFLALLFWLYYNSIIVVYCAEITNLLAVRYQASQINKEEQRMLATA
jgi:membrane protein